MKIGFQGWFLTEPYTGIGQHCLGMLRALSEAERAKRKNLECIVVVPRAVYLKGIPRKWIRLVKPPFWLLHRALKKWWWEHISVPQFFASRDLDWEYYPYPCPLPESSPHLRAVTVHDTILWNDVRYQGGPLKTYYHKFARRSLVYAEHVFTVSHATHGELGIPTATVLGSGAPEVPKKIPTLTYQNALVYLGGYDLRKNVPELVKTFLAANKKLASAFRLVLIGKPLHQSRFYPEVPEDPSVIHLGPLTDDEVYKVLHSAFAFVHFSDSEGFNIPLLEAMLAGTPAIVRDLSVNREVSQNSAFFLPTKGPLVESLLSGIKLLQKPAQRKSQIAAQKKAASRYSWKKSAQVLLKTLNKRTRSVC